MNIQNLSDFLTFRTLTEIKIPKFLNTYTYVIIVIKIRIAELFFKFPSSVYFSHGILKVTANGMLFIG